MTKPASAAKKASPNLPNATQLGQRASTAFRSELDIHGALLIHCNEDSPSAADGGQKRQQSSLAVQQPCISVECPARSLHQCGNRIEGSTFVRVNLQATSWTRGPSRPSMVSDASLHRQTLQRQLELFHHSHSWIQFLVHPSPSQRLL